MVEVIHEFVPKTFVNTMVPPVGSGVNVPLNVQPPRELVSGVKTWFHPTTVVELVRSVAFAGGPETNTGTGSVTTGEGSEVEGVEGAAGPAAADETVFRCVDESSVAFDFAAGLFRSAEAVASEVEV